MNNPDIYQNNNNLQKQDAIKVLQDNLYKIKWSKSKTKIIDIGSGDGAVTANILKKYIPCDYEILIGCDISEEMVHHANKHYANDKTTFMMCDIGGCLPDMFKKYFDHAFSFYALNWVLNQQDAFRNIYDLLVNGGDCLLMFSRYNPVFTAYRILAKTQKWSFWLTDVDRYVTPYQNSQEPDKDVAEIMKQTGFQNVEVIPLQRTFIFNTSNSFKNFITSVNPFRMPKNVYQEYLRDFIQLVTDNRVADIAVCNDGAQLSFRINYGILVAYGLK